MAKHTHKIDTAYIHRSYIPACVCVCCLVVSCLLNRLSGFVFLLLSLRCLYFSLSLSLFLLVLNLPFKSDVRRVDRVNGRISYIEGGHTPQERAAFLSLFTSEPVELTAAEKAAHLAKLTGVALSSDAFFPFRDNIDQAAKRGVSYIAQPGGSVADEEVTKAVNEYDMKMVFTGVRLFHH